MKGRENTDTRLALQRAVEGLDGTPGLRPEGLSFTVSTKDDAPREELDMSSGQAPVLSATPGAHDGQVRPTT